LLATIGLLLAFALLVAMGIKESARVAQAILLLHVVTLSMLCLLGIAYVLNDPSTLRSNLATPFPDVEIETGRIRGGSFATALFFGFASAILGVSGFESSAQFVQSQAPGVFVKVTKRFVSPSACLPACLPTVRAPACS
jgi:amino acid transporter